MTEPEFISVTLGAEHDSALWARLVSAVAARGGSIVESSFGVGGSQEVIDYEVRLPEGRLQLRSETYVGLVLTGRADLVEALSREARSA